MSELRKSLVIKKLNERLSPDVIREDDPTYQASSWSGYFDKMERVENSRGSFAVYVTGDGEIPIVFLHGAGHSSLTWCCMMKELIACCPSVKCYCIDLRAHGETNCQDENDLSMPVLVRDVTSVIEDLNLNKKEKLAVVGHSLGGAVAVSFSNAYRADNLKGIVVIDVVEGSALNSLSIMDSYVYSIPKDFQNLPTAIQWSLTQHKVSNLESAKVSVPGQLVKVVENGVYTWRVNLLSTKPYWKSWFDGMSKRFLSCSAAKLLILGGDDRLDKELTIGQMQGKFTLKFVEKCGHMIQEDDPNQTAQLIHSFLKFQQIVPQIK